MGDGDQWPTTIREKVRAADVLALTMPTRMVDVSNAAQWALERRRTWRRR
jgi:multimeric flavodoxin WrbA